MNTRTLTELTVLGQEAGGAYNAGRIVGMVFLIVLVGAIVWKLVKNKGPFTFHGPVFFKTT